MYTLSTIPDGYTILEDVENPTPPDGYPYLEPIHHFLILNFSLFIIHFFGVEFSFLKKYDYEHEHRYAEHA